MTSAASIGENVTPAPKDNQKKWIFFYTNDYIFWKDHIANSLKQDFKIEGILIPEINTSSNDGQHHFKGLSIKIELLIEAIKKNMGKSIVFSDCTIWVNKNNAQYLRQYIDSITHKNDLIFADNQDRSANIGLILIDCNKKTLSFFERLIKNFNDKTWDQELINSSLPGMFFLRISKYSAVHAIGKFCQKIRKLFSPKSITWSLFDADKIVCNLTFPKGCEESFYIYKQFIISSTPTENWNQRLVRLNKSGLLSDAQLGENIRKY